MRSVVAAPVLATFIACGSNAPPKAAEPEPPPLVIPPLPPQKEPPPRVTTREPSSPPPAEEEVDSVPGPLALPCKSDAECMTQRCNLRFQKCAFPCTSDRDCIAGATCYVQAGTMATCIPKSP
jgi:hypothetical protein